MDGKDKHNALKSAIKDRLSKSKGKKAPPAKGKSPDPKEPGETSKTPESPAMEAKESAALAAAEMKSGLWK